MVVSSSPSVPRARRTRKSQDDIQRSRLERQTSKDRWPFLSFSLFPVLKQGQVSSLVLASYFLSSSNDMCLLLSFSSPLPVPQQGKVSFPLLFLLTSCPPARTGVLPCPSSHRFLSFSKERQGTSREDLAKAKERDR